MVANVYQDQVLLSRARDTVECSCHWHDRYQDQVSFSRAGDTVERGHHDCSIPRDTKRSNGGTTSSGRASLDEEGKEVHYPIGFRM